MDTTQLALLLFGFEETSKPSISDVDGAFRKLSLKLHPDVEGGSAQAFRALNMMREHLKDKFKPVPPPPAPRPRPEPSYSTYNNHTEDSESTENTKFRRQRYEDFTRSKRKTEFEDLSKYEGLLAHECNRLLDEAKVVCGRFYKLKQITLALSINDNIIAIEVSKDGYKRSVGIDLRKKLESFKLLYSHLKGIRIKDTSDLNSRFDFEENENCVYILVKRGFFLWK